MSQQIVVIGATSTLAEHCCRLWIKQKDASLCLVGRDLAALNRIAQDLSVRNPVNIIKTKTVDFLNPTAITSLVNELCAHNVPDLVFIAQGVLPAQQQCQQDQRLNKQALEINALSPILFAEAFANPMDKANKGCIVLMGSVAGDRGRQSNYAYGAAKSMLASYAQGMQHRFYGRPIDVILVKPGPTDTHMTAHLKTTGLSLADPAEVSKVIVAQIARRKKTIYAPKKWALIMWCIRHIPDVIFGKIRI